MEEQAAAKSRHLADILCVIHLAMGSFEMSEGGSIFIEYEDEQEQVKVRERKIVPLE